MQKLPDAPLHQVLAALCGGAVALSLHLLTNRPRSHAPHLLKGLGWVAIALTLCLAPLALLATAQFGASATLLSFVALGLALIVFVALLHHKQGTLPLSVAFLQLMAEVLGVALILAAVSVSHNNLAYFPCGEDVRERYGHCIEQAGTLVDRFIISLLLSLLVLELTHPFTGPSARRGIAPPMAPKR